MMATAPSTRITPEEYLERERKAETKSEYYRGQIFAMAGATRRHGRIVTNLVGELRDKLRRTSCEVYSTDLRLLVSPAGLYTYPDVMVICEPPATADDRQDIVTNPTVLIEVLSDSTKNYDRGLKFQLYRTLPSLREYITVAQDQVHLEHYVRQPEGSWLLTEFESPDKVISLQSIKTDLRLADVYERVDFSNQETEPRP